LVVTILIRREPGHIDVITARRPSTHPSLPGALVASAMWSRSEGAWLVTRDMAKHLVYVPDEATARTWLGVVVEVAG
jgi:hypothetical protein